MTTYSFYDAGGLFSGQSFSGPDAVLADNTPPGSSPIEGAFDRLSQRVDVTAVPPVVVDYIPPEPASTDLFTWAWDTVIKRWVKVPTLAARRLQKWESIKAAREIAIDAPLATPYGTFDSYAEARGNITDAVLLAQTLTSIGQPVAIAYTLADNSVVTLDLAKIVTVGLLLGSKVQAVRGTATALRNLIDAATTAAAIEAIQWPT